MSVAAADLASSRAWATRIAIQLTDQALQNERIAEAIMAKVETVVECANLPGDLPVRVRCFPNVFNLRC